MICFQPSVRRAFACLGFMLAAAAMLTPAGATAPGEKSGDADGWRPLFNGENLDGWDGDPELWRVHDGVIRGETTKEKRAKGNTFLIVKDLVAGDFELEVSFRVSTSNNSGIQYRSKHITGNAGNPWVVRGYQHELRNEEKFPNVSGFIYDEGGNRRRICLAGEQAEWTDAGKKVTGEVINQEAFKELFRLNDWNDVRIVAEGNRLKHFMNGTLILDFTDDDAHVLREGVIAFQLHAGAPMWAEFRNVRIREGGAKE